MVDPVFSYADPEETARIVFDQCLALVLADKTRIKGVYWPNLEEPIAAVIMTQLPTAESEQARVIRAVLDYFDVRKHVLPVEEVTIEPGIDRIFVKFPV